MACFFKSGSLFRVGDEADVQPFALLPPGNYVVQYDDMREEYYLREVDPFRLPEKVYGDTEQVVQRFLKTYWQRPGSTGVLLCGVKGSGKTLTAKTLSVRAGEAGLPTLMVNAPFRGDGFSQFLQQIEQPCLVLFDEFEKVYTSEQQESLLTLLDGVFPTKKLWALTCNERHRVNYHLTNRPGRIYYLLEFEGLDTEFVREYCRDNLNDRSQVEQVVGISQFFDTLTFDMLAALVDEMNRYGESPTEALRFLNAKIGGEEECIYELTLTVGSERRSIYPERMRGNPLRLSHIDVQEEDGEGKKHRFCTADLVNLSASDGEYVYRSGDAVLRVRRPRMTEFDLEGGLARLLGVAA